MRYNWKIERKEEYTGFLYVLYYYIMNELSISISFTKNKEIEMLII
jgi:hypothetical protein